jgi:dolichol kinase
MVALMASILLVTRSRRQENNNGNNNGNKMMDEIVSTIVRAIDQNARRSLEAVFLFSLLGLTLTLAFSRLAMI